MKVTDILNGWKSILEGRAPSLSIEITKECPLSCPGCYAYGEEHLGGNVRLREVGDYDGHEPGRPLYGTGRSISTLAVSIVCGEPLVGFRN